MTSILVIDDDPVIRELLECVLSNDTHRVETAHNGKAGMLLHRQNPFDVVITDILMPDFDGFEVLMEIYGMESRPRVIAMTGGSAKQSRGDLSRVAKNMGVEQVLFKPFTIDKLQEAIFQQGGCADTSEKMVGE